MKNDTIETTGKSDVSPFNVFDNAESQTVKAIDVTRETSSTDTEEKISLNQLIEKVLAEKIKNIQK